MSVVDETLLVEDALSWAIRLIERGWTSGAYARNKAGGAMSLGTGRGATLPRRVDLYWALTLAAIDRGLEPEVLHQLVLSQLSEPYCSDPNFGLERWNDQPYRTRGEVLMLLRNVQRGLR